MAKRKPKSKPKRPRKPRLRTLRKDERGVPLTDDRRPFTILPSDLLPAIYQPPGIPSKGTGKYQKPMTAIPELKVLEFTEFAFESVILAIEAADRLGCSRLQAPACCIGFTLSKYGLRRIEWHTPM